MKIILYAKSSDGINYYKVAFTNRDGIISIKCDCPAGELTKLCRHKLSLVRGDEAILYDSSQSSEFMIIKGWIKNSPLFQLVNDYDKIDNEIYKLQKELRKIKEAIEIAMRRGM
jgi:hypothetical protein